MPFVVQDSQLLEYRSEFHPHHNMVAYCPEADSVFVQLSFKSEAAPVDCDAACPYYDVGTQKPGSAPVNFKLVGAVLDANSQTVQFDVVTTKEVAGKLAIAVTKLLKDGAKAQITVKVEAMNEKQTVDQTEDGAIVQYMEADGLEFTMDESVTREFKDQLTVQAADEFTRSSHNNKTHLTDTISLWGKWLNETPVKTWSGRSSQKCVVGPDTKS
ncbi:hypothetical protein [Francisella salina]|uniref:Uncharacterized protein n=1 Tax=Francisella salina TaxID=573569 RepID=A0ABN3ZTJ9_FRAST|nr:hypothetical protein [Francisella salina]AEI36840.1 hypothetical protein F7308_1916 [Francisella salina]